MSPEIVHSHETSQVLSLRLSLSQKVPVGQKRHTSRPFPFTLKSLTRDINWGKPVGPSRRLSFNGTGLIRFWVVLPWSVFEPREASPEGPLLRVSELNGITGWVVKGFKCLSCASLSIAAMSRSPVLLKLSPSSFSASSNKASTSLSIPGSFTAGTAFTTLCLIPLPSPASSSESDKNNACFCRLCGRCTLSSSVSVSIWRVVWGLTGASQMSSKEAIIHALLWGIWCSTINIHHVMDDLLLFQIWSECWWIQRSTIPLSLHTVSSIGLHSQRRTMVY